MVDLSVDLIPSAYKKDVALRSVVSRIMSTWPTNINYHQQQKPIDTYEWRWGDEMIDTRFCMGELDDTENHILQLWQSPRWIDVLDLKMTAQRWVSKALAKKNMSRDTSNEITLMSLESDTEAKMISN